MEAESKIRKEWRELESDTNLGKSKFPGNYKCKETLNMASRTG